MGLPIATIPIVVFDHIIVFLYQRDSRGENDLIPFPSNCSHVGGVCVV
jgi:hypothetical protein